VPDRTPEIDDGMRERVSLRRAGPGDEPLLYALFAADKAAEFVGIGWAEPQYRPLLEMQFRGRAMTCLAHYPEAEDWIVSLEDGTAVGRCLLVKTNQEDRVLDLVVLPQWRRRGVGTRILQELMHQSLVAGVAFRLRVARGNQALRLYARLGFEVIGEDGISFEMVWRQRLEAGAVCRAKPKSTERSRRV
jgi:ribosomal protein S18 acetylase RimI-like enzyme